MSDQGVTKWKMVPEKITPTPLPSEEEIATRLLDVRGFGFYTDPMEGGQTAYDISLCALEEARAILTLLKRGR